MPPRTTSDAKRALVELFEAEPETEPIYQQKIKYVSKTIFDDKLHPILVQHCREGNIEEFELYCPPYIQDHTDWILALTGKDKDKLEDVAQYITTFHQLHKKGSIKQLYGPGEEPIGNKAIITGCSSYADCKECEQELLSLATRNEITSHRRVWRHKGYVIEITCKSKQGKNRLIDKWVHSKDITTERYKIYTYSRHYHREWARRSLKYMKTQLNKMTWSLPIDKEDRQCMKNILNKIWPPGKEGIKGHLTITAVPFLACYNIEEQKGSVSCTVKPTADKQTMEKFRVMCKNIGAALDKKLQPETPLWKEIYDTCPHVLMIVEHNRILEKASFDIEMAIKGYKLVGYLQGFKQKN